MTANVQPKERPKPFLFPEYCKGCGRCIEACPKHCIELGTEINPLDRARPGRARPRGVQRLRAVHRRLPGAVRPAPRGRGRRSSLQDPHELFGDRVSTRPAPRDIPDERVPLPRLEPLVIKGTYASAIGRLLAGCRHFFGYPITPSTEGAELMAKLLPQARRRASCRR